MDTAFLSAFLPESFLDYFDLVSFTQLGNVSTKQMEFELHLDERNTLPVGYAASEYESKGFLAVTRVQDFPIRGKAVYLLIRRRRWRHKSTRKEISNNYSFIAEGARLTQELSDFLKGTGRDSRRYN